MKMVVPLDATKNWHFQFDLKQQFVCVDSHSSAKLCDIELLLHGLNLEYLSDTIIVSTYFTKHSVRSTLRFSSL